MGTSGPSAVSIAFRRSREPPDCAVFLAANALAEAELRAGAAPSAAELQQSSRLPAIGYRQNATEIGSHSPHYALKVEISGVKGLAAAPFSAIRSDPPGGLPCPQLPVIRCLLSGYTRGALRPRA